MSGTTNVDEFNANLNYYDTPSEVYVNRINGDGTRIYLCTASSSTTIYSYDLSIPYDIYSVAPLVSQAGISGNKAMDISVDANKLFTVAGDIIQGYLLTNGNITTLVEDTGNILDMSTEATGLWEGIKFSNNGSKLYCMNITTDRIYQYNLSAAYDLTTATFINSTGGISTNGGDLFVSEDGLKLYVTDLTTDLMYQYNLTIAYDITSISNTGYTFYELLGNRSAYNKYSVSFNVDGSCFFLSAGDWVFKIDTLVPWKLDTAIYDHPVTKDVPAYALGALFFSEDGTRRFEVTGTDYVRQWVLATPFDVSTMSLQSGQFLTATDTTNTPTGIAFSPSGTEMYILGNNESTVYQYNLTTAWDVETSIYEGQNVVISEGTYPICVSISRDGINVYVGFISQKFIVQYEMSTPFDISTATSVGSLDISAESSASQSHWLSDDGKRLFTTDITLKKAFQYTLSAPWNIASASYDNKSLDLSAYGSIASAWLTPDTQGMIFKGSLPTSAMYNLVTYSEIEANTNFYDEVKSLSPSAYWRFGESEGSVAVDEIITYDGVYDNSPTLNVQGLLLDVGAVPLSNTAVLLDGVDQSISIPALPNDASGGVYIVCRFTSIDVTVDPIHLFTESQSDTNYICPVSISSTDGKISFYSNIGGVVTKITGTTIISIATTYNIFIQSKDGVYEIWVNGVEESLTVVSGTNDGKWFDDIVAVNTVIGGLDSNNDDIKTNLTAATIDDVFYINSPLSTTQIQRLNEIAISGGITKYITGTIIENTAVDNWGVQLFNLDDGVLEQRAIVVDDFSFTIDPVDTDKIFGVTITPDQGDKWQPEGSYFQNSLVFPTTPKAIPYFYKAIIGGGSDLSEPAWPIVIGSTVVDNGVTWECIGRMIQPLTHSPMIPEDA